MSTKKKQTPVDGTTGNDIITATSADEIFDLKTGTDTITFDTTNGKSIGNNTVVFNDGEKLTLDLKGIYAVSSPYSVTSYQDGIHFAVSGEDLVISVPDRTTYGYGKIVTTKKYNPKTHIQTVTIKAYSYNYETGKYSKNPVYTTTYETLSHSTGTVTTYGRLIMGYNSGKCSGIDDDTTTYEDHHDTAEGIGELQDKVNWISSEQIVLKGAGKQLSDESSITLKINDNIIVDNLLTIEEAGNTGLINSSGPLYSIGTGIVSKGKTIKGSYLNENLFGTSGNDKIYAIGGKDHIYSGGGNDKIYLGDSSSVVTVYGYDSESPITAGDIIYGANSGDTLKFTDSTHLDYARSGNDLIIINDDYEIGFGNEYTFNNSEYENRAQKVTIKNFFKSDDKMETFKYDYYADHNKSITNITDTITNIDAENNILTYSENKQYRDDDNVFHDETEDGLTLNIKEFIKGKGKLKAKGENTVFVSTGKSTITTGNGDDTVYLSSKNETVNINGSGNKLISITDKLGSDTINITNRTDDTHININTKWATKDFYKVNDDLVITCYDKNRLNYAGNAVIKDYFKDTSKHNFVLDKVDIEEQLSSKGVLVYGNSTKKNNLKGTNFNDTIYGGTKVDTITTGNGNDKIYLGKGNDIIEINGSGDKLIVVNNGDGTDRIRFATGSDGVAKLKFDASDAISYERKDDDLILYRTYDKNSSVVSESTVIENYFSDNVNPSQLYVGYDILNNYSQTEYQATQFDTETALTKIQGNSKAPNDVVVENNQLYIGGKKDDNITINADVTNSAIFAGAGKDTITVSDGASASIHAGGGNDTIVINEANNVNLVFKSGEGNDTIEFKDTPTGTVTMDIYSAMDSYFKKGKLNYEKYASDLYKGVGGFTKDGNNLIYKNITTKGKIETITILNYFNNDNTVNENIPEINLTLHYTKDGVDYYAPEHITLKNKVISMININGEYNSGTNKTTFNGIDLASRNFYYYNGNGNAEINASIRDDYINLGLNNKTNVYIDDKKGDDVLILNTKNTNLRAFFNVGITTDEDGNLVSSTIKVSEEDANSDNLFFFNKKQFTASNVSKTLTDNSGVGVISINNHFKEDGAGDGHIEYLALGTDLENSKDVYFDNWIDSIKGSVANWLCEHNYTDTMAVFEANNTADITSLLNVYASVTGEVRG